MDKPTILQSQGDRKGIDRVLKNKLRLFQILEFLAILQKIPFLISVNTNDVTGVASVAHTAQQKTLKSLATLHEKKMTTWQLANDKISQRDDTSNIQKLLQSKHGIFLNEQNVFDLYGTGGFQPKTAITAHSENR